MRLPRHTPTFAEALDAAARAFSSEVGTGSCEENASKREDQSIGSDSIRTDALAAAPIAVHAGHDHRAARPEFLHVGCRAFAHRITAREIARIDTIRFRLAARIDRHASRRPSNPDLAVGLGWRRLRHPHSGRCGLRSCSGRGQRNRPDKGQPNCRRLDPLHRAHPSLLSILRSPIAAPTSTGPGAQNRRPKSRAGRLSL
jgi:hypothetical protein